jgi:RND family efflux transporter MFP subunit
MNTARHLTLIVLGAAVALSTACSHEEAELSSADLPPLEANVTEARAVTAERGIEVYGTVQPAVQSFVSARVMGPVVAVNAHAGQKVAKGATLLRIQPETATGQLAQAQGALAQTQAALSLAERNLARFEALHEQGAASDLELDMARMQNEQAEGAVKQAEGAVQAARTVAADADVTAPFPARVVERLVEVGDMAAPGRPLVRLESLDGRHMRLTVREGDIHRLELGQTIAVSLDARADLGTIQAEVTEIVPAADPATHTFTVKVDLGDVDVPSGLSGRATLAGDAVERVLVPESAVHRRGGLELVMVRADDGTARTRAVKVGAPTGDDWVEILSGIKPGDTVITDAAAPVADGTPVEVRS